MTVENFIPELWSEKFLTRLRTEHVYANVVNRDYEKESGIKKQGDSIRIQTPGTVTVAPYTRNTLNLTPELLQGANQVMTIEQADYFFFYLDDLDEAQTMDGVMDSAMDEASFGMRDATDSYIATVVAAQTATANIIKNGGVVSSTTNPIQIGTGVGDTDAYELLVTINTRMNRANIPTGNRWCVVDPAFFGALLLDPRFSNFATQGAFDIIRKGAGGGGEGSMLADAFKMLVGMSIYCSNNVPHTSEIGESDAVYTILAGYKGAVTYAEQIAKGTPEAFRLQTGIGDAVRGLQLYDCMVTRPDAVVKAYVQYSADAA